MKFIINPLTNEKTLLKSPEGKQILLEYVKHFQEGGVRKKRNKRRLERKKTIIKKENTRKYTQKEPNIYVYLKKLIEQRNKLNKQIVTRSAINRICPSGMIVTYNIQGTYIKSGLFDGTLKYIQDTPSIFCVQEIGGLTKNQTNFIRMRKGGYNFRDKTIRQAQVQANKFEQTERGESGFFGNSVLVKSDSNGAIFKQGNWICIQYYWNGPNKGPKDTAILYNDKSYKFINTLSIPFKYAGSRYRPIGGVLLNSKNLERQIAVFTIHMPSLGGGVIPQIYTSIIEYLNDKKHLGIDIFLVGDFNLDSDTANKKRKEEEKAREGFLNNLLTETGSRLYSSQNATHQSGRTLDYIIHRPAGRGIAQVQKKLHTLLSYNVARSDHSSLGLCLKDIFPVESEQKEEEAEPISVKPEEAAPISVKSEQEKPSPKDVSSAPASTLASASTLTPASESESTDSI